MNLRNINDIEVRKQYQIEISDRFAALKNLYNREDIKKFGEDIKENTKV
jgi:hypothetical protein